MKATMGVSAGIATAALLVAAACGSAPVSNARPPDAAKVETIIQGSGSYLYNFKSVGEMVATSDLAILGRVSLVSPGRAGGDHPPFGQSELVTVTIEELLFGKWPNPSVTYEQSGFDGSGNRIILDGRKNAVVGDHGVFILRRSTTAALADGAAPFTLINNQGLYVEMADQRLGGSDPDDLLVTRLNRLTLQELRSAIIDAREAIARGEIQPL